MYSVYAFFTEERVIRALMKGRHTVAWLLMIQSTIVLGMSLRKVTSLGSNLASVTDLKRIEIPHSLCCDFGGYKTFTTRWSGGRVQVWVQVWAPACHLAISPKAVPEDWEGKIYGQALGAALRLCLRGSDGQAQTQCVTKLAAVAAGRDRLAWGNMLPLLQYWLGSRVNKV